jgi:hypothetical protein
VSASEEISAADADGIGRRRAFRTLEGLSFLHSGIYIALIIVWIVGGSAILRNRLGWAHGVMWIVMSLLMILAARKLVVSFRLAVLVVVIGGLGPFAGTVGFLLDDRSRKSDGESSGTSHNQEPQAR